MIILSLLLLFFLVSFFAYLLCHVDASEDTSNNTDESPVILIDASISGNILTINPVVDMIVPITPWLVALSFMQLVLLFYKGVLLEVKQLNSISMRYTLPFFVCQIRS